MVCPEIGLHWSDLVGFIGFFLLISSYFFLQQKWLMQDSFTYSFINLLVAIFIGVSLIYRPNYVSITVEIFWGLISLWGCWKNWPGQKVSLVK